MYGSRLGDREALFFDRDWGNAEISIGGMAIALDRVGSLSAYAQEALLRDDLRH